MKHPGKGSREKNLPVFTPVLAADLRDATPKILVVDDDDGVREAMKEFLKPFAGKIKVDRFDMLNPKVQRDGDMALLTFNLLSYVKQPDRTEKVVARWNSSEVYRKINGAWKIIHSHWSFIKPEIKAEEFPPTP